MLINARQPANKLQIAQETKSHLFHEQNSVVFEQVKDAFSGNIGHDHGIQRLFEHVANLAQTRKIRYNGMALTKDNDPLVVLRRSILSEGQFAMHGPWLMMIR